MKRFLELAKSRGLLLLRLAKAIAPSLPEKDDGALQIAFKGLAAIESAREVLEGGKGDPVDEYVAQREYVEQQSEPFVSLFFDSTMSEGFAQRRFELGQYESGIEAKGPAGEILFTCGNVDRKPRSTFYHSPSFVPKDAVARVWEDAGGRMTARVASLEWGETKTRYGTFPEARATLHGAAPARLAALVDRHRRFQVDGIQRSYGFYGEPGTGKTLLASLFAARVGHRTLKVDAESFAKVKASDFAIVLEVLEPDFVIVDDVDKAPAQVVEFLGMMERFGRDHPETTLILTANSTTGLDRGLLRPERVSEWLRFEPPDDDERLEILLAFLRDSKLRPTDDVILRLAAESAGLTQDYLREVALSIERSPAEEVSVRIARMKELLAPAPTPDDSPTSGCFPKACT